MSDKPASKTLKYSGADKLTAVRLGPKIDSKVERKMQSTGRDKSDVIRTAVDHGIGAVGNLPQEPKPLPVTYDMSARDGLFKAILAMKVGDMINTGRNRHNLASRSVAKAKTATGWNLVTRKMGGMVHIERKRQPKTA